jgi:hypothetical protein
MISGGDHQEILEILLEGHAQKQEGGEADM